MHTLELMLSSSAMGLGSRGESRSLVLLVMSSVRMVKSMGEAMQNLRGRHASESRETEGYEPVLRPLGHCDFRMPPSVSETQRFGECINQVSLGV